SVVLPAPFGPTTVTSSRAPTTSDTSQTATASPGATSRRSTSSIGLPAAGADHVRITHDLTREAFGDDATAAQHHHAVGEIEDGSHDGFHGDDGRAAIANPANELERMGHLRRRQAREHLVQQTPREAQTQAEQRVEPAREEAREQ